MCSTREALLLMPNSPPKEAASFRSWSLDRIRLRPAPNGPDLDGDGGGVQEGEHQRQQRLRAREALMGVLRGNQRLSSVGNWAGQESDGGEQDGEEADDGSDRIGAFLGRALQIARETEALLQEQDGAYPPIMISSTEVPSSRSGERQRGRRRRFRSEGEPWTPEDDDGPGSTLPGDSCRSHRSSQSSSSSSPFKSPPKRNRTF